VPDKDKLIAVGRSEQDIANMLGADSLAYLPDETLTAILTDAGCPPCTACFSGNYTIDLPKEPEIQVYERPLYNVIGK
jgi:amidophosphoribosyltransferase